MRILILLLAAVIVALGAGAFLYTRSGPEPAPQVAAPVVEEPKAPELVEVFTPSTPIAAGTIMTESVLRTFEMDPDKVSDEMIVVDEEGREFLIGGVARHSLAEGVPIARTSIIHPGDRGFLAAVLPKGMRAISIEITEVAGLSGLVLPGDHVDLILTYTVTAEQGDHERDIHASETLIHNIRVLALDQRVQAIRQQFDKNGIPLPPPIASTATLEVTPRQAEMISLSTRLGRLSLVLNSAQDGGTESGTPSEMDDLLGPIMQTHPSGEKTRPVSITGGPRELTLDTDVTSLLARLMDDAAEDNELDAIPHMNKIDLVQIVRGRSSRSVEIGAPQPEAGPENVADTGEE